jgi:hypothetical protein
LRGVSRVYWHKREIFPVIEEVSMQLGNSERSPEQVVLILGKRGAALLAGAFAGAVVALGMGVAVLTMMYR